MMGKIGFIGAGNMAFAIAKGISDEIFIFDRFSAAYEKFSAREHTVCPSVESVVAASDIIVLSVKPQNFTDLMPILAAALEGKRRVIVSIAAGITLSFLEKQLKDQPVVRVMPNTPLLVGAGATVLSKGTLVREDEFDSVRALFAAAGLTAEVEEAVMNDEVAIHGSSPAIFFEMADRVMAYGSEIGLSEEDAKRLFCQTMLGSAKMMLEDTRSPKELSAAVCSPGGTTLAMLSRLSEENWWETMIKSFEDCARRAEELAL